MKIKGSPITAMIIRTIFVMSFSILQHCCAPSLPSGFRYFQTESAKDSCPPCGRIAANLQKICIVPHNYPQVSARNNHRVPRKRLSFPCHVPYIPLWYVRQWSHIVGTCYLYTRQPFVVYSYCLMIPVRVACYKVYLESDYTSILFCSSREPSPYFHSAISLEGEMGPGDIGPLCR